MPGDLIISLCLNGNDDFVESFQIPYDITWADLEAMLKAQFDADRIAVSYIDTDNDEVSIGSQEELFEAFRVAMRANHTLQLKVMTLTPEAAVFRMPDDEHEEPEDIQAPLDLREVCPDPSVPIPLHDKERDQDIDRVDSADVAVPEAPEPTPALEQEPAPLTIVMPDCDQQVVISKDSVEWQKSEPVDIKPEPACDTEEEKGTLVDIPTEPEEEEEDMSCRSDQLLAYSDFVSFMTKLKKELRCEIVRDVTRKTVKQVLKGLDGAVIESLQGSSLLAQGSTPGSLGSSRGSVKGEHAVYVHDGVFCDSCNNVIVGPRYKCGNCLDFDLCETCEAKAGMHNPDHVFVKIRRPCYRVGVIDGVRKPLLKAEIYKTHRKCGTKLVVPILGETTENENELNFRLESKMKDIFARNEDKRRKKDEKKLEKLKRKEEKLKRRMECRSDPPLKRERLELLDDDNTVRYDFYKVLMGAEVLACLNVPDGTKVQQDTKFTKTWKVKNSGDGPWSESTKLRLLWGNIPVTEPEQDVPHLKPGEEGEITVSCISPAQPGDYQSHWKLYEHGMGFGARIWCSIVVVRRETLEPTIDEKDSLKVITETFEKLEVEDVETKPEQTDPMKESIEITFRSSEEEEHLREVAVKRETSQSEAEDGTSQQEAEDGTCQKEAEDGISLLEAEVETSQKEAEDRASLLEAKDGTSLVEADATTTQQQEAATGTSKQEAEDGTDHKEVKAEEKDLVSETGEGYVVYARCGEGDVFEVPDTKNAKKLEDSQSIADDLTTAVARLTLENEQRSATDKASHTATPHNTPYDLTPMKTPNPEPEELTEPLDLKPISNSSSVELVTGTETDDHPGDTADELVQQRMASLELKPDIDLESVSSYSDDDEEDDSSLSDSDYIIVPLPDCFDITKPLNQSFSSYSNSVDRTVSLDDNHNTLTDRASREGSVDDMFSTSVSLPTRPLSPTPSDIPSLTAAEIQEVEEKDASATSEAVAKGDNSPDQPRGAESAEMQEEQEIPAVQPEMIQSSGVNSSGSMPASTSTSDAGVSSPDLSSTDGSSDSGASGAASAQSTETQSETPKAGETTGNDTELKEPVSASAELPDNVQVIKSGKRKERQSPPKTVDFAPDFANQLVTTAVNAAGQAYITAKAVFKTWQDKQQADMKNKAKDKSPASSGKSTPPTGWKPASTQWAPPSEEEFKPAKPDWKPPEPTFKPPKSQWKPVVQDFKPPKSDWKPPAEDEAAGPKESWKPPEEVAPTDKKEQWTPPKEEWTPPKESGPMGQLFEMGFFDRDLNQKLLYQFNNDIEKVIQELLAKKNADWAV